MPYTTATPEQMSANSTAWSLKKSTGSFPPLQSQRENRLARRDFVSQAPWSLTDERARLLAGWNLRVRELHVRGHLIQIAVDVCGDGVLQQGDDRAQRVDRELRLLEVACLLAEAPVAERGDGEDSLDED